MINKSNIVLVGFMGCGKSTVGKELAKKIDYSFTDSDSVIETKIGMSISDFFVKYGENEFRSLEEKVISEITKGNNQVIATGGGIIKNPNNISLLRKTGTIFYLDASATHIFQNLKDDTTRPLLNTDNKLETIHHLLNERKHLYKSCSHYIIDVNNQSVDDITNSILEIIRG